MAIKIKSKIIQEIRKFVQVECRKPTSKYGYGPYTDHFMPMVEYGKKLARELKADVEIVELAGWLHDIGSIVYGRVDHHMTGAKIAEEKLTKLGYPKEKINKVKDCIYSHRGSQRIKPKTVEAQIIVEADTLSAFDCLWGLFECAYVYEKLSRKEAKKSVRQKLENKWEQLRFKKSKEMIKPKYKAAMLLLK